MAMALVSSVDNSTMRNYRKGPPRSLTNSDIAGARSRVLHREMAARPRELDHPRKLHPPHLQKHGGRAVMNLTNLDISGSTSAVARRVGPRGTNPLQPEYKLPGFDHRPYTPHQEKRNRPNDLCLNTTDIEGTVPSAAFVPSGRDTLHTGDIEGANTTWRPSNRRFFAGETSLKNTRREPLSSEHNQLYVGDINDGQFRTNPAGVTRSDRNTNPLMPVYAYDVEHRGRWPGNGEQPADSLAVTHGAMGGTKIGPIMKSSPRTGRALRNDPEYNMMTEMDGATCNWAPPNRVRKDFGRTNYVGDIHGTHATHTKPRDQYMVSARHIDPVNPNYDSAVRSRHVAAGGAGPASIMDRHPILRRGSEAHSSSPMGTPTNAAAPALPPAAGQPAPSVAAKPSTAGSSVGSSQPVPPMRRSSSARSWVGRVTLGRGKPMSSVHTARVGGGSNYGSRQGLLTHKQLVPSAWGCR